MNITDYEKHVRWSRSQPIAWLLNMRRDQGQEATAYELTQQAIKAGYVTQRDPVHGNTLKDWIKKNKAPHWAALAACDLVVNDGWTPEDESAWAVFAHLFVRKHKIKRVGDAFILLPENFDKSRAINILEMAVESAEEHQARREAEREARLTPVIKCKHAQNAILHDVSDVAYSARLETGQVEHWRQLLVSNLDYLSDPFFDMAIDGWSQSGELLERLNTIIEILSGKNVLMSPTGSNNGIQKEVVRKLFHGHGRDDLAREYGIESDTVEGWDALATNRAVAVFEPNWSQHKDSIKQIHRLIGKIETVDLLVREKMECEV